MINFILWLVFGALVGWLASIVMRTDAQQGALLNIVVGIVGAFLGGLIFNFLGIGGANINQGDFSLGALLVSFVGAVILLAIVNMFRRGTVR
ncbi:MAG TPA: GlsB/YeaQ/YmgE family stress response membrane protein [Roseiflexaceae bacterium]|nr:GlsB/YeaQ/YmgE family stress response membrane protein [Roseiflexaceae bacterium]